MNNKTKKLNFKAILECQLNSIFEIDKQKILDYAKYVEIVVEKKISNDAANYNVMINMQEYNSNIEKTIEAICDILEYYDIATLDTYLISTEDIRYNRKVSSIKEQIIIADTSNLNTEVRKIKRRLVCKF